MLEQLLEMAQSQLGNQFTEDPEVDNNIVPQASQVASSSVLNAIMDQVKGGNISAITEMLSGSQTDASHPEVQNLVPGVANNLMSQLGIGSSQAQGLAGKAIPVILNMLNGKVQNAQSQGGFDVASLLGQLTGGGAQQQNSGAGGILSSLAGSLLGGGGNNSGGGLQSTIINGVLGKLLGGK